jgi:hypothetical protein
MESRKRRRAGYVARVGGKRNSSRVVVEDTIKMGVKERGSENVDWIISGSGQRKMADFFNTLMNPRGSIKFEGSADDLLKCYLLRNDSGTGSDTHTYTYIHTY